MRARGAKPMTRKKICLLGGCILLALVLLTVGFFLWRQTYTPRPPLGVWWWDEELDSRYLDFAKAQGVTEIYYCSSAFHAETESFIRRAGERGMAVYWLAGEYEWVLDDTGLHEQIAEYLAYQNSRQAVFSGIHLDIEPHQHPQFHERRAELLTAFAELCIRLRETYPDLYIEYDLPFWLDDEITVRGQTKPAYQFVIDAASRVTVMSYRDTSEAIYAVATEEVAYAAAQNKPIQLSVETKSSEGEQVSFAEEGAEVLMAELAKVRELLPDRCGVAVHHIETWYALAEQDFVEKSRGFDAMRRVRS